MGIAEGVEPVDVAPLVANVVRVPGVLAGQVDQPVALVIRDGFLNPLELAVEGPGGVVPGEQPHIPTADLLQEGQGCFDVRPRVPPLPDVKIR